MAKLEEAARERVKEVAGLKAQLEAARKDGRWLFIILILIIIFQLSPSGWRWTLSSPRTSSSRRK